MILKDINIRDFRCFDSFECKFKPKVNVLIGRNGAGKTTLIHAIHKAMSFIFSNDRSLGKEFLSQGNNTLNVRSFKESDYHFDSDKREQKQDVSITATACYGDDILKWKLYRRNQTNAALYQSLYKEAFATFMRKWKEEGALLPLLAYFSDSYPHKYVKTVKYALDIVNKEVMPRNFGYYQWDDEASCTSIWETRFCNCLNRLQPYYTKISKLVSELKEYENIVDTSQLGSNYDFQKLKEEASRIIKITSDPRNEMNFIEARLKEFAKKLPKVKDTEYEIDLLGPEQTSEEFNCYYISRMVVLLYYRTSPLDIAVSTRLSLIWPIDHIY